MAGGIVISVVGDRQFNRFLLQYSVRVRAAARKQIAKSAMAVETGAKADAPKDTGRLHSSIRPVYSDGGLTADVGTDVKYAKFMEYGTARRGKMYNKLPLPTTYQYGSKHNVSSKYLRRWSARVLGDARLAGAVAMGIRGQTGRPPGLRPRPFLTPNFIIERPKFLLGMRNIVRRSTGFRRGT